MLVTLAQVDPVQQGLEVDSTQAQVEVQALALAVDVIAVLVEVARTGGIDLTQIAGEI